MKIFLAAALILLSFSCKKGNTTNDVTKYNWVLKTATVTPAIIINGKTTTNYKLAFGEHSCFANNYTYMFLNTGIYQVSSTGSLCDMMANSPDQKWTKDGNTISLINKNVQTGTFNVMGNQIVQTSTFTRDNVSYTLVFTYKAAK